MSAQDASKRGAAEAAIALVEDGMRLGLGTGSTAWFAVEALARRVHDQGLRVQAVPTSLATQTHAAALGLTLRELGDVGELDLAIDGADEIERSTLRLIKGLGGALLREKIVAEAARRFVVIGDAGKIVERLGTHAPLPVEVTPFAHQATGRRLPGRAMLRLRPDGTPFVTDNGNLIYDCTGLGFADPAAIGAILCGIAGVVEHGLFLSGVEQAIIGQPDGTVRVLRPAQP